MIIRNSGAARGNEIRDSGGQIGVLLFDAGNTLVHLDYEFIATTLIDRGHAIAPREIRRAEYVAKRIIDRMFEERRGGNDETRRYSYFSLILEELGIPAREAEEILAALTAANTEDCLWRVILPDTNDTLHALQERGFALGVVSNADGRIEADLHRRGIGHHFRTIIDSHVVGIEKPNAGIFRHALRAINALPEQTLYVGDIYSIDVRGARNADLTPLLLDPLGRYHGVDCERIRVLADLLDLLPAPIPPGLALPARPRLL